MRLFLCTVSAEKELKILLRKKCRISSTCRLQYVKHHTVRWLYRTYGSKAKVILSRCLCREWGKKMFNRFRALGTGAVLKILSDEQVIKCSKVVSKERERNEAACRQRDI